MPYSLCILKHTLVAAAFIWSTLSQSALATEGRDLDFKKQLPLFTQSVKSANTYSWGMVGTPSAYTESEVAIRILFKKLSDKDLYEISSNASTEGKMYILCALKRKKSMLFKELKKQLELQDASVVVFTGSILAKVTTASVISQIEKFNCDPLNYQID